MKDQEAVWLVTFVAVVVLDVALGLLIGIVFSLYFVLRHSQKPHMSQMGQLPGTGAYKDVKTSKKVTDVPGMKIFRFESSVYFANAEHFRDRLYEKTGFNPRKLLRKKRKAMHKTLQTRRQELEMAELEKKRKENTNKYRRRSIELVVVPKTQPLDTYEEQLKKTAENKLILDRFAKAWQPPIKIIIVDLSVVNYVDTVAVKMFNAVVQDYKEVGIKVFLAGCKPEVREMLRNAEFNKNVAYTCLYFTVHEAVVIGQEIVDEEIKKKEPKLEDVKLFKDMSAQEADPNKKKENEDDDAEFEDEEEEDNNENKSDDEEHWYDTSPDSTEMTQISRDVDKPTRGSYLPIRVSELRVNKQAKDASKQLIDASNYEVIPLQDKR